MPILSLQDVAEKVVKKKKKPIEFKKLWEEICKELNFNETEAKSKLAKFYHSMSVDSRFIQLEGNTWDLKSRQSYEKIKVNVETIEFDDEDDEDYSEENSENFETVNAEAY